MAQLVKIKTINNLDTDIQVGPDTIQEVRIIRNFAVDATRFLVQITLISGRSYYLATADDEMYFENRVDAEALRDAFIATIPNTGSGGAVESVNGRQGVVTGLVDEADIVDNLTTNDATKPLSAKQGKVLQDTKEALTNKAINFSVVNDTKYPTTKAVKDLVDATVGNIDDILDDILGV